MKTNKKISPFLCFAGLLLSGASFAQDAGKGVYVGFSTAQARASFDGNPPIAGGFPINYDNSSGVWKGFAGYQFNQYLGAELAYAKLGDYNVNVNVNGTFMYTQTRINAWYGSLVGTLPLGKGFSLLGKIGEAYTRESRGDCNICIAPVSGSSDNVWSPIFGVGAKYEFNPNWSVRAEAERFTKVGNSNNTFGGRINLWSAGVAYKF